MRSATETTKTTNNGTVSLTPTANHIRAPGIRRSLLTEHFERRSSFLLIESDEDRQTTVVGDSPSDREM